MKADEFATSDDDDAVECPSCHKDNDLSDTRCDGCLDKGFEFECNHCGAALIIEEVEWKPTITVRKAQP